MGALLIFLKIKKENINKFIAFSISFSLAIMIGISVTDLIPKSFFEILKFYHLKKGIFIIIIISLVGYLLITILNKFTEKYNKENNLYKLGILNMMVLIIHNLPEGIVTFMSSYKDINLGIKLGIAIMFHNIPEGIAISIPIYYSTKNKKKAIATTILSGLAEPVGAIFTYIFLKNYITNNLINIIMLLVGSIMITLSIKEMFPEANKYQENKYLLIGLVIGIIFILFNIFILKI